jgi:uncharacterized protein (DUF1499 family)
MDKRGRFSTRAGATGLVLSAAGAVVAHFGLAPPLVGFGLFALGGLAGIVGVVGGATTSFRYGLNLGRAGIFFGILPAAAIVLGVWSARDLPRINDITTDVADPPAFVHAPTLPGNRGRDLSFPEAFGPIITSAYPDLEPLRLAEPPEKVFARAALLAGGVRRWTVTYVDEGSGILEGHERTRVFRFVDDFVVRVRPDAGGTRVDMRSKSRDGQGDLGANAARIRSFLGKLEASAIR